MDIKAEVVRIMIKKFIIVFVMLMVVGSTYASPKDRTGKAAYMSGGNVPITQPYSHLEAYGNTAFGVKFSEVSTGVGVKAHCGYVDIKLYLSGVEVDSLGVPAGTGIYIPQLCDSVYVIRTTRTVVIIVPSKYYTPVIFSPSSIPKSFAVTHGDTITADTTRYGLTAANADPLHAGTCVYFESLMLIGDGNSNGFLFVKLYKKTHLVAQFLMPVEKQFQTTAWRFDSLWVEKQGTVTHASFSLGWDNFR